MNKWCEITLSLLGCRQIESEIDYRKLSFFGQLCNLNVDFVAKKIFNDRIIRYDENPNKKKGFIPDIYRLLCKYNLADYF